jgi:hypothetical protein
MKLYLGTRAADLINIELLRNRNDITDIVLVNEQECNYASFSSTDGLFTFDTLLDWVNEKHIELTIVNCWKKTETLLHDINDDKFKYIKKVIPWETAFFNTALNSDGILGKHNLDNFTPTLNSDLDIKHTMICLNNKPHTHRCLLMDLFAKYNLIDNQAISWIITTDKYTTEPIEFYYWKEQKLRLHDTFDEVPDGFKIIPQEYKTSFVQVINESNMDNYFITEKTVMPLLLQKPFIVINKKNYNSWLKELGFELYDEIFDYSFDSIENDKDRFEMGVKEIYKLNLLSRKEQFDRYISVKNKLLLNKQRALELGNYYPEIVKPILSDGILKYDAIEIE